MNWADNTTSALLGQHDFPVLSQMTGRNGWMELFLTIESVESAIASFFLATLCEFCEEYLQLLLNAARFKRPLDWGASSLDSCDSLWKNAPNSVFVCGTPWNTMEHLGSGKCSCLLTMCCGIPDDENHVGLKVDVPVPQFFRKFRFSPESKHLKTIYKRTCWPERRSAPWDCMRLAAWPALCVMALGFLLTLSGLQLICDICFDSVEHVSKTRAEEKIPVLKLG